MLIGMLNKCSEQKYLTFYSIVHTLACQYIVVLNFLHVPFHTKPKNINVYSKTHFMNITSFQERETPYFHFKKV